MHHQYRTLPKRAGSFSTLALSAQVMQFLPYVDQNNDPTKPKRKSLEVPPDNDTYVKPIKQSFVKNPRLMPMTKIMLTLLSGWAGNGKKLETTTGIIAKHVGRCQRQVFRYLKDAVEEGYLYYNRTKDKVGRYIGIRVFLNFSAIRFTGFKQQKTQGNPAENLAMTYKSETNRNYIYNIKKDDALEARLEELAITMGLEMPLAPRE